MKTSLTGQTDKENAKTSTGGKKTVEKLFNRISAK